MPWSAHFLKKGLVVPADSVVVVAVGLVVPADSVVAAKRNTISCGFKTKQTECKKYLKKGGSNSNQEATAFTR